MLYSKIKEDLTVAMKAGDSRLTRTLKLITSELSYAQVDFKGGELPDDKVIQVLLKESKKRKDSIEIYSKAGDENRADEERYELEVIESYLPEKMSEDKVLAEIEEIAMTTGLRGGKLMGAVMGKLRGKVDSEVVQKIVNDKFKE